MDEVRALRNDVNELKNEKESLLWKESLSFSFNKIWDNERDDEWRNLL